MRNVATVEVDRSGLGRFEADKHVKARRLARTVCSEQADDLALIYVKTDVIDHSPTTVRLLQILRRDRLFARFGNVMPVGFGWNLDGWSCHLLVVLWIFDLVNRTHASGRILFRRACRGDSILTQIQRHLCPLRNALLYVFDAGRFAS